MNEIKEYWNSIDWTATWNNVHGWFVNLSQSVKCPFLWGLLFIGVPILVLLFIVSLFSREKEQKK